MKACIGILIMACLITTQGWAAKATLQSVTIANAAYSIEIRANGRTVSQPVLRKLGLVVPSVHDGANGENLEILVYDKRNKQVAYARLQDLDDDIYYQINNESKTVKTGTFSKQGRYCSNYSNSGSCYANNACEWDTPSVDGTIDAMVDKNGQISFIYARPTYNGMADGRNYCKEASQTQSGDWQLPEHP